MHKTLSHDGIAHDQSGGLGRCAVAIGLPIGPVGVPEATTVLCGGDGELIRALALGLAILSVVILLRTGYRVAASAIGSTVDSVASLVASVLPGLYLVWLTVVGSDVIACLSPGESIQQLPYVFGKFMAIAFAIVDAIGTIV